MADGRYVLREAGEERVLVLETLGAPAPPRRRRRRPRESEAGALPASLPLARATLVRAFDAFGSAEDAQRWLDGATVEDDSIEALTEEAVEALNRALHAQAVASGDPSGQVLTAGRATGARIGYGSGEQVANGDFEAAAEIDPRAGASRRRQRTEELRPQERVAALIGGREQLDACETLLLRARADLDAGREREAALQLRIGFEALLVELNGALPDPKHEEDMAALKAQRKEVGDLANRALQGGLDSAQLHTTSETLALCERVLRRRRVLRG